LIMDEPTNHLDIQSKNVLKAALIKFKGTLIVVSHDREFLQGLTELVYEFRDHKLNLYLGDIDYYLGQRKAEDMRAIEKVEVVKEVKLSRKQDTDKNQLSYEDQKKQKSLNNRLSKAESQINDLEKNIAKIDAELAGNYDELSQKDGFFDGYQAKKRDLDKWMQQWENVSEELEKFNN
jgi:ATP-binding cassette subfamily F protein 3